jgi:hypothetical protein
MQFQPKTEKEIAEANLIPVGVYSFEVVAAEDKVSKANNEMIVLKLLVHDGKGGSRFIDDYLLESIAHKLRHAAVACGLESKYTAGKLAASDFQGKTGQVKVRIQKDKDGQYPDKNVIGDYVVPKDGQAADPEIDDSIPF